MDIEIEQQPKRWRWPLDASLTIALFALFLSAIQFVVTLPLFNQLFFGPKLVAQARPLKNDPQLAGMITVENTGKTAATDIEIGVFTSLRDDFIFIPDLTSEIKGSQKDEAIFQNRVIKVGRLLPDEMMTIMVTKGSKSAHEREGERRMMSGMTLKALPSVSFLRSAEGSGVILPPTENYRIPTRYIPERVP